MSLLNLRRRKGGREGRELWPESLTTVVLEQAWPPPRLGNGGEAGFAPRKPSAEVGSASAGQEPGSSSGGTVSSLLPGDVCQEEGDRAPSERKPGTLPPSPPTCSGGPLLAGAQSHRVQRGGRQFGNNRSFLHPSFPSI